MTPTQLVRARKKAGLSQFALAKRTKVSRSKISQYENHYTELSGVELNRITRSIENVTNKKKQSKSAA